MRPFVDPARERLRQQMAILEGQECGCKSRNRPLCVHLYGTYGCTGPRCVKASRPHGCTGPACITEALPRGCTERRQLGDCGCPRRPCQCPRKLCECPVVPGPPCPHLLAADHDWSIDDWAGGLYLLNLDPEGDSYANRPAPLEASNVSCRAARVEILSEREGAGFGLWNDDDVVHMPPAGVALVATAFEPPNGRAGYRRPTREHRGPSEQAA